MKIVKSILVFGGLMGIAIGSAMAATTTAIVQNFMSQAGGWTDVLSTVAYIAGIVFGMKAAFKLKEHNESKGQIPVSTPITMFIVAGLLIALPSFLTTAADSVNGVGARKTGINTGALRSVQ